MSIREAASRRALKLYAVGHLALLAGAVATHVTGSMLPIAFASSTCLMFTAPLVRHLAACRKPPTGPHR